MEKGFTITYEYGENLYVNTTNRCNFNCEFCLRHNGRGGSIYTHNLWLEREPTKEEILADIESRDLAKYKQLVFCGFGEPSYRIEDICWVIDQLKAKAEKKRAAKVHRRELKVRRAQRAALLSQTEEQISSFGGDSE